MTLAAATMVGLGLWQLSRYHYRSDINARIDAAAQQPPLPLAEVLAAPDGGRVGAAPAAEATWSVVTVTGRYDQAHEILARIRTLHGTVGFEVITPLVLADGTAVLVDRGWIPAAGGRRRERPGRARRAVGRGHGGRTGARPGEPGHGAGAVRRPARRAPDRPGAAGELDPYPLVRRPT